MESNNHFFSLGNRAHFIGIGGTFLSALALQLKDKGFAVKGTDLKWSPAIDYLIKQGVDVIIGRDRKNIDDCDFVVKAKTVPDVDPEVVEAGNRGLPILTPVDLCNYLRFGYLPSDSSIFNYSDPGLITSVFSALNENQIEYLVCGNYEMLPDKFPLLKDIDIMIPCSDNESVIEIIRKIGFNDYSVLLNNSLSFSEDNKFLLYYHNGIALHFQNYIYGIKAKTVFEINHEFTKNALHNRFFSNQIGAYIFSPEYEMLYLICRALYVKQQFSDYYIERINELLKISDYHTITSLINEIFNYDVSRIVELIKNKNYNKINELLSEK